MKNMYETKKTLDLDLLVDAIGDAHFVLLGEASHGTSDFYKWRSKITKKLIEEKGFNFIAVEGDWPDCYRLNQYIKDLDRSAEKAKDVLFAFNRWPTWMWANWEINELAEWLKLFNSSSGKQVGFYGLDVYSLWESLESIISYLEHHNHHDAAEAARKAWLCFEHFAEDSIAYARYTALVPKNCEEEVVQLLCDIQKNRNQYQGSKEDIFSLEQNAYVAINAERYYRAMIKGGPSSWNLRDRHMFETLERLINFYINKYDKNSKVIIWEHNTHVGDARATDMQSAGMFNIGQLIREKYQDDSFTLGFGTYEGTVIAGSSWGAEMEVMSMPKAQKGSWEEYFHNEYGRDTLIVFDERNKEFFSQYKGHRAIGVVYDPLYERLGNYVPTSLSRRYDAFMYLEETQALHPLHVTPISEEVPETYPWGI